MLHRKMNNPNKITDQRPQPELLSCTGGTLTSLEVLPDIRRASKLPIIFDSGVERGMDILRALALGADFVMLGSAWHFALGALGRQGPAHLTTILQKDLIANMGQLGLVDLNDCARCLCSKIA